MFRAMTAPDLAARYRTLFVLGRGGMGSVEAALQTDPARVVALKRLLPDAARDRRRVDMFLREARLATMLDHPNIVRAWDFGELDGELYLAMEFAEGPSLARLLRALRDAGEELPVAAAAWLVAEICEGLHAAHDLAEPTTKQALNLVHRDVSPQNVIVGHDGRVRILDFGIAKIATESTTKTGEVKGKSAYMSPEQAMGDPLDRRSDLFGIGAVLHECLTLRRMWGEGTDMEMIRKLALEVPPSLATAGRALPPGLVALHARLVARSPADRPATAHDVAVALRAFADEHAASIVRALVERHFGDEGQAQRARLGAALEDTARSQAEGMRESTLPGPVAAPPRDLGKLVTRLVALVLLVLLFVYGYRMQIATVKPDVAPPPLRPVTSFALPAEPAPSNAPPPPSSSPAPPVAVVPSARPTLRPPAPARTAAPVPSTTSAASVHPPPRPPDVDEHPF